jgi:hypothetical protein
VRLRRAIAVSSRPPPPLVLPLDRPRLPDWAEPLLDPPGEGEFFASRLWYETLLGNAMPARAEPLLAADPSRTVALPLLRRGEGLASLTGPYSLAWRPLAAPAATPEAIAEAGRSLAAIVRGGPPLVAELIDPGEPRLAPLCAGLRARRVRAARFAHVGAWHETLADGVGWEAYLAARPPALRNTVARKLARAGRTHRLALAASPGAALEAGIVAYEEVRARSWKPDEPFPGFDAALLRAAAAAGVARLGVLHEAASGRAVAAQYWVLDRAPGGLRRATVLKLAHDEAARAASPGTVLTALMIRHLVEAEAVRVLDFGRGDDAYKQLWAGARLQRIGLVLADPLSPRGAVALARQWGGALLRRLRAGGVTPRDGRSRA